MTKVYLLRRFSFLRASWCWLALLCIILIAPVRAADTPFATPLTAELLDNTVTAEWVGNTETSRQDFLSGDSKLHWPNQLAWFVATSNSRLGWAGITFGAADSAGPRHLRVGFLQPVPVGTLLTRGKLTGVSVLRATAAYPGDMGDDTQWTPAQSVRQSEISTWILPPGTSTRAVRLTYASPAGERQHAGSVLGMYLLTERLENIAPDAVPLGSNNIETAPRLIDGASGAYGSSDGWSNVGNIPRTLPITPEEPEWVMLVWPQPVTLRGLCAVWALAGQVEVQMYTGPTDQHPREAPEADWQPVVTGACAHRAPESFNLNWLDFGRAVTTRAVRLRILSPAVENNFVQGQTQNGRRCMLGELLAMRPLGQAPVQATGGGNPADAGHPPIPVTFTLAADGYVTLVIDDAQGQRAKNLISETFFTAGTHTVYWDGLDESGSIPGPYAGIYKMVGQPVVPGTYTVRGLYRKALDLSYEFSVYSPGSTPWLTGSHWSGGTGGWLADHSAPTAVLSLPGTPPRLLLTSPIAESSHGIIWTDLEGNKLDGKLWVGGIWTGASHLAHDAGPQAAPGIYAYSGSAWEGELRLVAFGTDYRNVAPYVFAHKDEASLKGLAVYNGLLVASLPKMNALLLVDALAGKVLGTVPLTDGRGLAFDQQGRLLALSGQHVLRFPALSLKALHASLEQNPNVALTLPTPETLVAKGLLDPQGLTVDTQGRLYVSDWGTSHQVKVFAADGAALRVIGAPGGARPGPYDPQRMDHPQGITITPDDHLWVAEDSYAPKRVSVWTLDGALVKAFYGPPQYGGGGTLDAQQVTRLYYGEQGRNVGLEFALDWAKGTAKLKTLYYMPGAGALAMPHSTAPETSIYREGRQYMTDVNNTQPVGGPRSASIWMMQKGLAQPVASLGSAFNWPLLGEERFRDRWPVGFDPKKPGWDRVIYTWSDSNADAQVSPEEVTFATGQIGSLTVNDRLEFCTAGAEIFAPERFTANGTPIYDLTKGRKQLANFYMEEVSSASGQIIAAGGGWTVGTGGKLRGIRDGKLIWTYPNEWPGQQAGVFSTPPTHPGELMATTRQLGLITPRGSDVGEILAIDGDKGNVFLVTTDGMFVATLFHDVRLTDKTWTMPVATRGMSLSDITLYDEEFWTTATQTQDGKVYLVAGKSHISIVRVDGLESLKRLPTSNLQVTPELLEAAQQYRVQQESARLALVGRNRITIQITPQPPVVDGAVDEWIHDDWVTIDSRANARLNAETGGKIEAAVRVAGDRLFVAYRTKEPNLLANSGDAWQMLFKTGGALDVMLGASPTATPKRTTSEAGDLRLLVTLMHGKPIAVLYQPVSPGVKAPAKFSSPWRTITFDRVVDVSAQLDFAAKAGAYEFSVPLATLGLTPKDGLDLRGDVGVLRGNGFQTLQRLYWQNKATSTVADVPTEATFTPHLWGIWHFQAGDPDGAMKK